MRKTSYTVIVEQGFRVVREFEKPETVVDVAEKLFGAEVADDVKTWLGRTIEGTYSHNGLRIHKILGL